MNFIKVLRSREMGSMNSNAYKISHSQSIILNHLLASNDREIVVKIYLKLIRVKDHNGNQKTFLAWMTNSIIGELLYLKESPSFEDYRT